MIEVQRKTYTLLMSFNPCEIFTFYGEREMHGLKYDECVMHKNNKQQAYIAGFSNYVPAHVPESEKDYFKYEHGDDFFVFLNLSRCNNTVETVRLIFHELMHRAFELYDWDVDKEEDMISWADEETAEVFKIVKENLKL
jgi:hypothetical protein